MNYDAERAMNQKRLRMENEGGHGVVQGNGLPLNYMDNGHQLAYGAYPGAYNTHYPPPEAFSAYGPPPPGSYAPQNLSYAPPAHQNYPPHHQSFPPQQPQQLHMGQPHMGYGVDHGGHPVHKSPWPQHILAGAHEQHKPLEIKPKAEVKLEPTDAQKRPHSQERDQMECRTAAPGLPDMEQPKIKIKTDIFKPEDMHAATAANNHQQIQPPVQQQHHTPHPLVDKPQELAPVPNIPLQEAAKPIETFRTEEQVKESTLPEKIGEQNTTELSKPDDTTNTSETAKVENIKSEPSTSNEEEKKPGIPNAVSPIKTPIMPMCPEPKKRGRPKGTISKPRLPAPAGPRPQGPRPQMSPTTPRASMGRPRGTTSYYNAVRPFRKDFSGIQFRRRFSDDGLESAHIPNEVYFGDVPVSMEVLFNYYDANAEKEKLHAIKQQQAKIAAAKLQARGIIQSEQAVTTVDSSSDDSSSDSGDTDSSDSDEQEEQTPKQQRKPQPKTPGATPGKRGRPPVPPELRTPGIGDMKKFCRAAGIRFDYKKLTEGLTKNKERVEKMHDLLVKAGLEGKPTMEKCQALKVKKEASIAAKKSETKRRRSGKKDSVGDEKDPSERRMTRGATGSRPRQRILISSDEDDEDARVSISKLRQMVKQQ